MKICVVAARSGSKGLPHKNIKPFAGKPLLAHSIAQAVEAGVFDVIAVTSDSAEYLAIGREAGATLLIDRPAHLATDTISKPPILSHALSVVEAEFGRQVDILVDLQPTSPLRMAKDIPGAVRKLVQSPELNNVVSVGLAAHSPYYTIVEETSDGRIELSKPMEKRFGRRQDLPTCYTLNGSIYAWRRDAVIAELTAINDKTGYWEMDDLCNFDIDTPLDFDIAAFVAGHHFGW